VRLVVQSSLEALQAGGERAQLRTRLALERAIACLLGASSLLTNSGATAPDEADGPS
jgi:hypothetical protein